MMRFFPLLGVALVLAACRRDTGKLLALPTTPRGLPVAVDPADNPTTLAKVNLGRFLFFEPRIGSGDFMSCVDCHRADHGWAGRDATSVNAMGRRTRRKALSAVNAAYPPLFAWDGRAKTLEDVIKIGWSQLGMTDEDATAAKLAAIAEYRTMFTEAFGGPPTGLRVRQALGAYLRALKDGDSPYDRFVSGEASAMSDAAKRGLATFRAFGCEGCHAPPLFSDYAFHNAGIGSADDAGRFEVTKLESDRGRFRTPSLRSVANSGPWFHDGSAATLAEAIRKMASGGVPNANLDPLFQARTPTAAEIADIEAFLGALTGKSTIEPPKTLPGGRPRT